MFGTETRNKGVAAMKLTDISHGPKWILWVALFVLAIISIVLISGHGSWLVSGYNTAPKKEKEYKLN